jgi:hypothetical protein
MDDLRNTNRAKEVEQYKFMDIELDLSISEVEEESDSSLVK